MLAEPHINDLLAGKINPILVYIFHSEGVLFEKKKSITHSLHHYSSFPSSWISSSPHLSSSSLHPEDTQKRDMITKKGTGPLIPVFRCLHKSLWVSWSEVPYRRKSWPGGQLCAGAGCSLSWSRRCRSAGLGADLSLLSERRSLCSGSLSQCKSKGRRNQEI